MVLSLIIVLHRFEQSSFPTVSLLFFICCGTDLYLRVTIFVVAAEETAVLAVGKEIVLLVLFLLSANKLPPFPLLALFWNPNIKTVSFGKKRWWYDYTNDSFSDWGKKYQRKLYQSILMKGSCGGNENNIQRKHFCTGLCNCITKIWQAILAESSVLQNWRSWTYLGWGIILRVLHCLRETLLLLSVSVW